jgi:hypothetical protein
MKTTAAIQFQSRMGFTQPDFISTFSISNPIIPRQSSAIRLRDPAEQFVMAEVLLVAPVARPASGELHLRLINDFITSATVRQVFLSRLCCPNRSHSSMYRICRSKFFSVTVIQSRCKHPCPRSLVCPESSTKIGFLKIRNTRVSSAMLKVSPRIAGSPQTPIL